MKWDFAELTVAETGSRGNSFGRAGCVLGVNYPQAFYSSGAGPVLLTGAPGAAGRGGKRVCLGVAAGEEFVLAGMREAMAEER